MWLSYENALGWGTVTNEVLNSKTRITGPEETSQYDIVGTRRVYYLKSVEGEETVGSSGTEIGFG